MVMLTVTAENMQRLVFTPPKNFRFINLVNDDTDKTRELYASVFDKRDIHLTIHPDYAVALIRSDTPDGRFECKSILHDKLLKILVPI